ncbi:MAG: hypothetical protein ACM33V_11865 [Chloroflexota bacterium]|nr:hypothetical protein [Anaerolineales bacterium]
MDVAVYNYLKSVADDSVQAGISTGTLQNGGVGLVPPSMMGQQDPSRSESPDPEGKRGDQG